MNILIKGESKNITGTIKPEKATHIAINKKEGFKNYFCYIKDGSYMSLIEESGKKPFQIQGSHVSLAPCCFDFHAI